ncbi:MAG: restriction endonuclease subunit S, partial [Bacilli bacterium]|nr:restriction endonuclease subunit S [Bacilli bacterium]
MKPKLRFKNFDNDWEEIELKNIASEIAYGMNSASKEYDGENKYIRITDIDENSNRYSNKDMVSPDGILEDRFLVKDNDILFARTGASTGKTYLYNSNDGKLYYAGFLIKASIINHNSNFIFQQTKLNKYKNWIKIMSMRSGQPGINSQEYGSYKFSITNIDEENKVSNFLSLLDKKIELQSKKIKDLKLFK